MVKPEVTEIGPATNGAKDAVEVSVPYVARVEITGTADLLFHRWNVESIAEKAVAAKGSREKKTDNIESYVYRDDDGHLCLPGEYLRGAIVNAAKYRQDPRSPRKSAQDLFKAGIVPLTVLASLGTKRWDFEHKGRVQVQRNGITRTRPAMKVGWKATFDVLVNLPEYIPPDILHEVVNNAGRLVGVGDFRPTYGRFRTTRFQIISEG